MLKKALIAGAVLATAVGAQAQQSAGFGVEGTISPSTCKITLTGGVVNYGALAKTTVMAYGISGGTSYTMGTKQVPISVICDSPLAVTLAFVDNKAAQRAAVEPSADVIRFGIGDGAGVAPAGAYQMSLYNAIVDGVGVGTFLSAPNGTTAWTTQTAGVVDAAFVAPGYANGFSTVAGATVPAALTTIGGTLDIVAFMSKPYVDAATSLITMNGSGTINLQYL